MGLVVYWYDFVCFAIVGVAFFGSLYVIWKKEGEGRCDDNKILYESLLADHPDSESHVGVSPRGHVSTSQLWTSCWRWLHPGWLLGLRFVSGAVLAGFLAWDIWEHDASVFIYYTEWTFALVIIYFALGTIKNIFFRERGGVGSCRWSSVRFRTIVSAYGCMVYYSNKSPPNDGERGEFHENDAERTKPTNGVTFRTKYLKGIIKFQSQNGEDAIRQRTGFWGYLMQTAYQTCAGAVILTDIVFWCLIVPFLTIAHFKLNLMMGCMHSLNLVFLLLDTSVNSLPFPWFRLAYFVLWSCCYVIFQWLIHACGVSWWPYPFLELSTPWAPLWYFCMALVHIPCYGLYSLLVRAKNSIFSKLFPCAFIRPS